MTRHLMFLRFISTTLLKFMFRNFYRYVKKKTLHCLISKSSYLHCNLTRYLLCLSVYLQNTCTELVGKSALKPLGDKCLIYRVTNLIIFPLETLASLVENKCATWNSKSSDKLPPPPPKKKKKKSSYKMVKEIADLVFMVAGKPALA